MISPFQWTDAASIDEALQQVHMDSGTAAYKAGGVDLLDLMKETILGPDRLVNLRNLKALDFIGDADAMLRAGGGGAGGGGGLRIGPLVTLARLSENPTVRKLFPVLAESAELVATPQIRNMATLGGNLLQRPRCWYFRHEEFPCRKKGGDVCFAQMGENQYHAIFNNGTCAIIHPSDTATALVALGATITLQTAKGKRDILLEKFFTLPTVDVTRENSLDPSELLTEIRIPVPAPNTRQAWLKLKEKESSDWPLAAVAAVLEMEGGGGSKTCTRASIVLGAAAPVPRRAKEAEALLAGKPITEDLAREAAEAALADASPMTQNGYKLQIFKAAIRRTILQAAGIS